MRKGRQCASLNTDRLFWLFGGDNGVGWSELVSFVRMGDDRVLLIDILTTEGVFAVFIGTDGGSLTSFLVCFHSRAATN